MLGFLSGKKKNKEGANPLPRLSSATAGSILGAVGLRVIPSMPTAAQRAFLLATDPSAEARDFVSVISADEALSARVLKIANSVFYDRGKHCATVDDAVLVIGLEELKNLLNANTLTDLFPTRHPTRTQLWANDIATALIARTLARRLNIKDQSLAFLGGLMHDIGKLLLLQRSPDDYTKALKIVQSEGCWFSDAEAQIFPFDHTEVGQMIGEQWRFAPELIEIIRNHHQPFPSSAPSTYTLAQIVKAADILAHGHGLGQPANYNRLRNLAESCAPQVWDFLRIPSVQSIEISSEFCRAFDLEYDLYSGKV